MTQKQIRFPPDSDEIAFISFNVNDFKKDLSALIINESLNGACFVVNKALITKSNPLDPGTIFLVQIGALNPMRAQIKWLLEVDANLLKIGVELLE
ncbi:MAG: hypothetical protein Q7U04_13240 [Bacteriovorax sp.]|nr:hypothetical protein [Bacteriovorax sp.]